MKLICHDNFSFFQILRSLGLLKDGEKLPWHINPKEAKKFVNTWESTYKYFDTKIRRQKERGQDVSKEEQKLMDEHFLCPDVFETIVGGLVPCRRKNARKRT